jgi:hypothetical protein
VNHFLNILREESQVKLSINDGNVGLSFSGSGEWVNRVLANLNAGIQSGSIKVAVIGPVVVKDTRRHCGDIPYHDACATCAVEDSATADVPGCGPVCPSSEGKSAARNGSGRENKCAQLGEMLGRENVFALLTDPHFLGERFFESKDEPVESAFTRLGRILREWRGEPGVPNNPTPIPPPPPSSSGSGQSGLNKPPKPPKGGSGESPDRPIIINIITQDPLKEGSRRVIVRNATQPEKPREKPKEKAICAKCKYSYGDTLKGRLSFVCRRIENSIRDYVVNDGALLEALCVDANPTGSCPHFEGR